MRVVVADFGLSDSLRKGSSTWDNRGAFKGTILYTAPGIRLVSFFSFSSFLSDFSLLLPLPFSLVASLLSSPPLFTSSFLSVEILRGLEFNEKSDVYSLGLVLWTVTSSKDPFTELNHLAHEQFVEKVSPLLLLFFSSSPSSLLFSCLSSFMFFFPFSFVHQSLSPRLFFFYFLLPLLLFPPLAVL